ncbi:MAG: glycoside hydrolase family 13 protein [Firmicutes bacterium]|nr:glycoside hydrolase family 13 protein [Bacillota bacterium]
MMEAIRKDGLNVRAAEARRLCRAEADLLEKTGEAAGLTLEGVWHGQETPYVERSDENTVAIRLRAKSGDVASVVLEFCTGPRGRACAATTMEPYAIEGGFTQYRAEVATSGGVLSYRFLLKLNDGAAGAAAGPGTVRTVWHTPSGDFLREPDPDDWYTLDVSQLCVFKTPEWVHDAVFYQIFPDRFANGDPTNDPIGTRPWGEAPTRDSFFGGDFQGIIDKIPYLKDLGITAVWFNPIFQSVSNHKYDTADYLRVDDSFGDLAKFRELVDALHAAGIRVILDGVFNHTGDEFWAFQDIIEKGPASRYVNWYYIHDFPVRRHPKPNYEAWWGFADLPKLNMDNPEVRRYILDVVAFWMKEVGIDGWRLDVPNEVDHSFWKVFRDHVKSINPDAYIVGEIWRDGSPWLKGDEFDAVMNYVFRDAVLDFFARRKASTSELVASLEKLKASYPAQASAALLNLLGSHDTERVLTAFEGDKRRMIPAVVFQMTCPGAPIVYYGDEVGMMGEKDPGCRGTMVWDERLQDRELLGLYRRLIQLRRGSAALRRGDMRWLLVDDPTRTFAFSRAWGNDVVVVAVCAGERQVTLELNLDLDLGEHLHLHQAQAPWTTACNVRTFSDALTGRTYPVVDGRVRLEHLGPQQAAVLVAGEAGAPVS